MKNKFKMRFSYFLIAGLIGYILEIVGFFMWTSEEITWSTISTNSSLEYFNKFMGPTYFMIFAALFIIAMCVGIILCAKKEQKLAIISSYVLGGNQALMILTGIVYLIFASITRADMDEGAWKIFIDVLVSLKNVLIYISAIATAVLSYGFYKISKKNRPISKCVSIISLAVNGLFVVAFTALFFSAIGTTGYELMAKFFDSNAKLSSYVSDYGSMNGFTLANLTRCFSLVQQVNTSLYSSDYTSIGAGAIFAVITIIAYSLSVIADFIFVSGTMIESFDVSRDDDRMSL